MGDPIDRRRRAASSGGPALAAVVATAGIAALGAGFWMVSAVDAPERQASAAARASVIGASPLALVRAGATVASADAPWLANAAPWPDALDRRPFLALVLAVDDPETLARVNRLDAPISVSLDGEDARFRDWAAACRAAGQEALLTLPVAPPTSRDGDGRLSQNLSAMQNAEILAAFMDERDAVVGAAAVEAGAFTENAEAMKAVVETLKDGGYLFVDARQASGSYAGLIARRLNAPAVSARVRLDLETEPGAVLAALEAAEADAARAGASVAFGRATPAALDAIENWLATRGEAAVVLAPVSAVVARGRAR